MFMRNPEVQSAMKKAGFQPSKVKPEVKSEPGAPKGKSGAI